MKIHKLGAKVIKNQQLKKKNNHISLLNLFYRTTLIAVLRIIADNPV